MNEWQKCPVCEGTGLVSRPPWVAGDVFVWSDTQTGPYPCRVCSGSGIIWRQYWNTVGEGKNNE